MRLLARWGKFNGVGAVGMGLQLMLLSAFTRCSSGHYLCASAAAVELTVLHNFLWHQRYTWRDREDRSATFARLWRFHLSNGVVSLAGNLLLMRVLVSNAHLPLLPANIIAILSCSLVNFYLSEYWTFGARRLPGG